MKIKPLYFVFDKETGRYIHNTTRDQGIYSSQAVELFTRADLELAYEEGVFDSAMGNSTFDSHFATEQLIEHDGKPYKEG